MLGPALLLMTSVLIAGPALAKLPPPDPQAQAAAAAAKDKAAWAAKVAGYQLCLAQERTVQHYVKTREGAARPAADTGSCSNPGPYVAPSAPQPAPSQK